MLSAILCGSDVLFPLYAGQRVASPVYILGVCVCRYLSTYLTWGHRTAETFQVPAQEGGMPLGPSSTQ